MQGGPQGPGRPAPPPWAQAAAQGSLGPPEVSLKGPWGPLRATRGPLEPPEGPQRAPGAWGFGAFCLALTEGPKGSQVPGQQDPGPPVTPGLVAWSAGGPGVFSLTIPEGPQGS